MAYDQKHFLNTLGLLEGFKQLLQIVLSLVGLHYQHQAIIGERGKLVCIQYSLLLVEFLEVLVEQLQRVGSLLAGDGVKVDHITSERGCVFTDRRASPCNIS